MAGVEKRALTRYSVLPNAATVRAGYAARMRWAATRDPLTHRVRLDGPGALAELREIGRRGEAVVGWAS